jgi:hypothetical protein
MGVSLFLYCLASVHRGAEAFLVGTLLAFNKGVSIKLTYYSGGAVT